MYTPSRTILQKYADVLVDFAARGGQGLKKNDTVYLVGTEVTRTLFLEVRKKIIDRGGHVIMNYLPDDDDRYQTNQYFYLKAGEQQLRFFPERYMRGLVDEMDHMIYLMGERDPHALKDIEPDRIMKRQLAYKKFKEWRDEKEHRGKFTWTLALYGTAGHAREAGLSERQYWNQIIKGCLLDQHNPVAAWRAVYLQLDEIGKKLNRLSQRAAWLHIEGPDADLWIELGDKRRWRWGEGRNIPSFEIFTSPDCRGTEGWIRFNQPLYRYGSLITDVALSFQKGRVVDCHAKKNEKLLKEMIRQQGADRVGEFSLTDRRYSRITKFMAHTLYDENVGGRHGNTHLALGSAYRDCFSGDPSRISEKEWEVLGYNDSSVHTDIMSTAPRTVTAHFHQGGSAVIYRDGEFTL